MHEHSTDPVGPLAQLHRRGRGGQPVDGRALGLTRPTVSRHVDLPEVALGTRLFLRTPQGKGLSDLGLLMPPDAQDVHPAHLERHVEFVQEPVNPARPGVRRVVEFQHRLSLLRSSCESGSRYSDTARERQNRS